MTRPDKHAARFGQAWYAGPVKAYIWPLDPRRERRHARRAARRLQAAMPAIRAIMASITANLRGVYADDLGVSRYFQGGGLPASAGTHSHDAIDVMSAVDAFRLARFIMVQGHPLGFTDEDGLQPPSEPRSFDAFIAHADEVLAGYDAQRSTGEEWPYKEF